MKKYVVIASLLLLIAGALYFYNRSNQEKDIYDGVLVENSWKIDIQGDSHEERYFVS